MPSQYFHIGISPNHLFVSCRVEGMRKNHGSDWKYPTMQRREEAEPSTPDVRCGSIPFDDHSFLPKAHRLFVHLYAEQVHINKSSLILFGPLKSNIPRLYSTVISVCTLPHGNFQIPLRFNSRILLAALHYNENSTRQFAKTETWEEACTIVFLKYKKGEYIVR